MGDLVKKTKIVPFINTGTSETPKWTQIKKSTSFTLTMNPQTKTFDFISSETPQNEIDSYQPSLAQSITMFKGEDDYETIFDMLFNRATTPQQPGSSLKPISVYSAALQKSFELSQNGEKFTFVDNGFDKQGAKGWGNSKTHVCGVANCLSPEIEDMQAGCEER